MGAMERKGARRDPWRRRVVRIPAGQVFGTDFTNLEEVKALAKRCGPGMSVVKHPDRPNYNITHTSRKDLLVGVEILFQT